MQLIVLNIARHCAAFHCFGCWLLLQTTVTGGGSTFLTLGLDNSALSESLQKNYITGSLFDDSSAENCGTPTVYSFDLLEHADTYTEAYVCDRYGAFWLDYLFTASGAIMDGNLAVLLTFSRFCDFKLNKIWL